MGRHNEYGISKSWGVNRQVVWSTRPVSTVSQCKLVLGWGLQKGRSVPPSKPMSLSKKGYLKKYYWHRTSSAALYILCLVQRQCKNMHNSTLWSPEAIIVPHLIIWSWYTGHWWVNCYIWYSEEGTGWGCSPPRPFLAVPNVTVHPSMASVPITVLLYNDPLLCSCNVGIKGLTSI